MSYNTDLQTNNTSLQEILATINALPDASSGVEWIDVLSLDGVEVDSSSYRAPDPTVTTLKAYTFPIDKAMTFAVLFDGEALGTEHNCAGWVRSGGAYRTNFGTGQYIADIITDNTTITVMVWDGLVESLHATIIPFYNFLIS